MWASICTIDWGPATIRAGPIPDHPVLKKKKYSTSSVTLFLLDCIFLNSICHHQICAYLCIISLSLLPLAGKFHDYRVLLLFTASFAVPSTVPGTKKPHSTC